jgi:branched-chain amino acid transport system substrate-binding protein
MAGRTLLGLLALALAGCTLLPTTSAQRTDTLRIGALAPASGTNAEKGDSVYNGVRLAVAQANAAGGILGKRVELVTGDDQSSKTVAPNVAANLIAKGVLGIVGNVQSSLTQEVLLKQTQPNGVVLISPASTSPIFSDPTQIDHGGWFFRTIANDALQGKALSAKAKSLGYQKLAVLYVNNTYGVGLASVLKQDFETAGWTASLIPYPETSQPLPSYSAYLDPALAQAPDAIALIGYPGEGSVILKDWIVGGQRPAQKWLFSEALKAESFVDNVSDKARLEGAVGTAPHLEGSAYGHFAAAYQERFGEAPSLYAANAYDAAMLMFLALEWGGEATRLTVKENLHAVSDGTGEPVYAGELAKALEAARAGRKINYEGASGPVDFDARGDIRSGTYVIWQIQDGKIANTPETLTP